MKSLTKYVVFSIITIIVFTIVSQVIFCVTGSEYGTLTTCFFACMGGEVLSCALIKIFKLKEGDKNDGTDSNVSADNKRNSDEPCG